MAWDPAYYQGYDQGQYYDPNYYGADWEYPQEPEEDTESMKLRKDQEEKERLEALEGNRLFLKKVKKQCAKEDFADLEKLQLFLFEVLIQSLEVNSDSTLGLLKNEEVAFVSARVRFLNSPYMEICETDKKGSDTERSTFADTDYFDRINDAGFQQSNVSYKESIHTESILSGERSSRKLGESVDEETKFDTKWKNANGKSCLFSMTPMMMIHDMDNYPVIVQVVRSGLSKDEEEIYEPVGYAQFRLPDEFSLSVLQSCKTGVILPVSSVHRETCDVKNVFGIKKGKIELFVRLSSFGPVIITSFQSTGPDRKYVFKPSPMSSNFQEQEERDVPETPLKPIFAEEDNTVGVTVLNNYDEFQVPVIWKSKKGMCDFGGSLASSSSVGSVRVTSLGSLRLPLSSQLSLCRDVHPPGDFRKVSMRQPVCDWHNLVGAAVKNSPGGNCGCIPTKTNLQDSPKSVYKSEPCCNKQKINFPQDSRIVPKDVNKTKPTHYDMKTSTTGLKKSIPPYQGMKTSTTGLKKSIPTFPDLKTYKQDSPKSDKPAKMVLPIQGNFPKPDDSDCGCNCPEIREYLKAAKVPFTF